MVLGAEWARCRWVWNECVAVTRKVHAANQNVGAETTCGPAQFDRMLTETRQSLAWLRAGASVPQQQVIRDFSKSRAKAVRDIKARVPVRRRAGMPRMKRKRHGYASFVVATETQLLTIAVEDFRPKFLAKTSLAAKAADAAIGATKTALIEMERKHGRDIRLVHPAHTTMDRASCGSRTKHALPLSERTFTCTACGAVSGFVAFSHPVAPDYSASGPVVRWLYGFPVMENAHSCPVR
ncbi:hypothetical protein [Streptomyces sp. NBC_01423]|uniref:hypothetical protein n=1 Tax=Streptomyces sp. NBC_01423 TaxID=2903860 RepID=UPI003FCD00E5